MKRLLTCLALLLIATPCPANIVSIGVTGPGGTGHGEVNPSSSMAGLLDIDFTNTNPITITVNVDSPTLNPNHGYEVDAFTSPWTITNGTGVAWTSFLLQAGPYLNGVGTGQDLQTSAFSYLGSVTSIWSHGGLPVGTEQDFGYSFLFQAPAAGSYTFTMTPNAPQPASDPISTPEPSSAVLMALGLAALASVQLFTRNQPTKG